MFCKSGSIVTEVKDGRLQATKIMVGGEEKYFMYWGESWVCGATSDDLITWTPIVDANKELLYLVVLRQSAHRVRPSGSPYGRRHRAYLQRQERQRQ